MSAATKKLLEAAKAEGQLKIVYGQGVMSGAVGIKRFQAGFNKYFKTDAIKIHYTPGPSFPGMARKTIEEFAAGKKSFSDMSIAGSTTVAPFTKAKVLRSVDWAPLLPHIPKKILAQIAAKDGSLISVLTHSGGIVYNTNHVKKADAPKTLKDLLNPKWKGKIATTPYAAGFGELGQHPTWGKDKTMAFARAFTENLSGLMRCGSYDRINSGEFWIFAISCSPGQVRLEKAKGAPLVHNILLDVLQINYHMFGVPKGAEHPNAATLFISWILTPEGQRVLFQNKGSDLHYLPGSQTKPILEAAQKAAGGGTFMDYNVHTAAAPKYPKLGRTIAKMFRSTTKKKK